MLKIMYSVLLKTDKKYLLSIESHSWLIIHIVYEMKEYHIKIYLSY